MKFFINWAFIGGITVMLCYYISTLGSRFFTYDSFTFVLMMWIVLGVFAMDDLIKFAKRDNGE